MSSFLLTSLHLTYLMLKKVNLTTKCCRTAREEDALLTWIYSISSTVSGLLRYLDVRS